MQIKVNPGLCTGCRLCEMECSFAHERRFGTHISRIRVNKAEHTGIDYPVLCQFCENSPCVNACPVGALSKTELGTIRVNREGCTGCGTCVSACPFGAMNLHPEQGIPIPCDLCNGDPACVKGCPTNALEIFESRLLSREKQIELMEVATAKRDGFARRTTRKTLEKWGISDDE